MAYPQDWNAVEVKPKELYPTDLERGKVQKKLLDLDETKTLKYFRDSDAAAKTTLDDFLKEGKLKLLCHTLPLAATPFEFSLRPAALAVCHAAQLAGGGLHASSHCNSGEFGQRTVPATGSSTS